MCSWNTQLIVLEILLRFSDYHYNLIKFRDKKLRVTKARGTSL
jgi:hypothetical protein